MPEELRITVSQLDWMPGFGAYLAGSVKEGPALVFLNLGAILMSVDCREMAADEVPYFVAETIMHEIMHALEDWAGQDFCEERVESMIQQYRAAAREVQG